MKKLIILLACIALSFCVLTACENGDSSKKKPSNNRYEDDGWSPTF